MATIGVRNLVLAILKEDEIGKPAVYDTPIQLAGLMNVNCTNNLAEGKLYGDDHLTESYSEISSVDIEFGINDLPEDKRVELYGLSMNEDGAVEETGSEDIPYIALGFKSKKSNGKFRYYWYYKGKMKHIDEKFEGTKDNIEFQTPTIKATFQKRNSDGKLRCKVDEDNTGYKSEVGANWFKQVYTKTSIEA